MNILEKLASIALPDPKHSFNSAIIAAAGSGVRMNAGIPKQLIELEGMPVVARTVSVFEKCSFINEIIIVTSNDCLPKINEYITTYGFTKVKAVVLGGSTRTESVSAGFARIDERTDYVLIHDAARCLVTEDMIYRVLQSACTYKAATAAERLTSTVKTTKAGGFIAETLDRDTIWAAQTPQVFKTELYRAASYIAKEDGFSATDDCMLAEHCGFDVKLVDCGPENIKLTSPHDLILARAIIESRRAKAAETAKNSNGGRTK